MNSNDESKISGFADLLQAQLPDCYWEHVADTADSRIVNVRNMDGDYLVTLTISRTPGH